MIDFGRFSFFVSTFIFAGLALFLEWRMWKEYFIRFKRVIIGFLLFAPAICILGDYFALRWGIWDYVEEHILFYFFTTPIDNVFFLMMVMVAVIIPTAFWADVIDEGKSIKGETIRSLKGLVSNRD